MKALLFNSGVGRRMGHLTQSLPKCLIDIGGTTLLEHQINNFIACGVTDFIITTGLFHRAIQEKVESKFSHINVTYVVNDKPASTNYIYSMWLAREFLNDDILVVHGDLVFDQDILQKLMTPKSCSVALANALVELPDKDFKAQVVDGKIDAIGVNVFGDKAVFLAPLYYIKQSDMRIWLEAVDLFVSRGRLQEYAETAFNTISHALCLYPVYYTNEFCAEIDNEDDLKRVTEYFKAKESNKHDVQEKGVRRNGSGCSSSRAY